MKKLVLASLFVGAALLATPGLKAAAAADPSLHDLAGAKADSAQGLIGLLDQLVAASQVELDQPGADPTGIAAQAEKIGKTSDALFAFVRDRIVTEPYAGALRGATGALAAHAGNSLDKSLLLVELLKAGGFDAHLMKGALSAEAAAPLLQTYLAADALQGPLGQYINAPGTTPGADVPLTRVAKGAGLAPEKAQVIVGQLTSELARLNDAGREKITAQTAYLQAQLKQSGVALGQPFADTQAELAAAVAEHFWVQVKVAGDEEKWLDLDPSFRAAKVGQVFASDGAVFEDTPAPHTLHFSLVYRTTSGGSPEDKVLLELTMPASEATLSRAKFAVQPSVPLPPMSALAGKGNAEIKAMMRAVPLYRGVFQFGQQVVVSEDFNFAGETKAKKDASPGGMSAMGGFGFGGGGGDDAPKTFVELDVLLAFQGPGREVPVQRRVLYTAEDTKSDCRSPMVTWELLLQPEILSPEFSAHETIRHQVAVLTPALKVLHAGKMTPAAIDQLAQPNTEPFPKLLMALAQLRQERTAQILRAHPNVTAFCNFPQLTLSEYRTCTCPDKTSCGTMRIDIVDNSIRFVPRKEGAELVAATCALEQGVADTFLEAQLLSAANNGKPVETPTTTFELARTQKRGLKAFSTTDEKLPLDLSDRAWVGECEPAQRMILVANSPARQAASVWWSLDPKTGTILGRASGGGGQAMMERATTEEKALFGMLKCMATATYDFARSSDTRQKAEWTYGISAFACAADMTVGFATPALRESGYSAAASFLDWAEPKIVEALQNNGP